MTKFSWHGSVQVDRTEDERWAMEPQQRCIYVAIFRGKTDKLRMAAEQGGRRQ